MKSHQPMVWLASLSLVIAALPATAEETAVVKESHVNVRGQPSLAGEVITQLQKGEKVVILEEVSVTKPKTNEPARWARIQMPPNTPVWVFAPYLDTNKTVKVSRLNLRAGPGENYSVVGRLPHGAAVTEIRRVEQWMEIETPPGAYGFVAADLLTKGAAEPAGIAAQPAPATTEPAPPVPSLAPSTSPAPRPETTVVPPPTEEKEKSATANPLVQAPPSPASRPLLPAPTEKAEEGTAPRSAEAVAPPIPAAEPAPVMTTPMRKPSPEAAPIRRVVRHEGIVRSTVSIQAPTYFELLSRENRKTINYLHTDKLDLNLKDYLGRRVVVTGEEVIDPRWPKTPVIEVETLQLIP